MSRAEFNPLQPGTIVQGRYVVEKTLGLGSMAVVYLCRDINLRQRQVAMKVLFTRVDEETKARFYKEIMYSYEIVHANVVRTYELIDEPDFTAITLEYVDGGDLSDLIFNHKTMSLNAAVDIMAQLCRGVHAIHGAGIVHRDLKPENVLITRGGVMKVADFSVAWTKNATKLTSHGGVIGSFSYISPEYLDTGKLDFRADIYALGVIAYEILTGQLPHQGDNLSQLVSRSKDKVTPPVEMREGCPQELSDIVMRALESDPEQRYQTVSDMYQDLERFSNDTGIGLEFSSELTDAIERVAPRNNPTIRPTEVVRRHLFRSYVSIGAIAGLAIVLIMAVISFNSSDVRANSAGPLNLKPDSDSVRMVTETNQTAVPQVPPPALAASKGNEAAASINTQPATASGSAQPAATGTAVGDNNASVVSSAAALLINKEPAKGLEPAKEIKKPAVAPVAKLAVEKSSQEKSGLEVGSRDKVAAEKQAITVKSAQESPALQPSDSAPQQVASLNSNDLQPEDQQFSEREFLVKAALLFKFLSAVEWPDDSAQDDSEIKNICIVGHDPFGGAIERILTEAHATGKISVRRFPAGTTSGAVAGCNIAYVNGQQKGNTNEIVEALEQAHVLTVTERLSSGIVHFYIHRGKVRFDINSQEARTAGLRISHSLDRLADNE